MISFVIRWVRTKFAWTLIKRVGPWRYFENSVTGQRWAQYDGPGFGILEIGFLRVGDIIEGPDGAKPVEDPAVL